MSSRSAGIDPGGSGSGSWKLPIDSEERQKNVRADSWGAVGGGEGGRGGESAAAVVVIISEWERERARMLRRGLQIHGPCVQVVYRYALRTLRVRLANWTGCGSCGWACSGRSRGLAVQYDPVSPAPFPHIVLSCLSTSTEYFCFREASCRANVENYMTSQTQRKRQPHRSTSEPTLTTCWKYTWRIVLETWIFSLLKINRRFSLSCSRQNKAQHLGPCPTRELDILPVAVLVNKG